uniref:Toxoplasma gondii family C protein n=1 Tax=Neospora caninum (strain Liverpool) TaxID=572307 RepID=A0A0F7UJJ4_NEOCL|nr:TPA: hypothetical protein BN1204_044837 [Neospora caninum Liverpool]
MKPTTSTALLIGGETGGEKVLSQDTTPRLSVAFRFRPQSKQSRRLFCYHDSRLLFLPAALSLVVLSIFCSDCSMPRMCTAMAAGFTALETDAEDGSTQMDATTETRFDETETHFDGTETRFDGTETRFDGTETHFDGTETHFDGTETHFDGTETVGEGQEGDTDAGVTEDTDYNEGIRKSSHNGRRGRSKAAPLTVHGNSIRDSRRGRQIAILGLVTGVAAFVLLCTMLYKRGEKKNSQGARGAHGRTAETRASRRSADTSWLAPQGCFPILMNVVFSRSQKPALVQSLQNTTAILGGGKQKKQRGIATGESA